MTAKRLERFTIGLHTQCLEPRMGRYDIEPRVKPSSYITSLGKRQKIGVAWDAVTLEG